jgi:hypothetical protein
MLEERRPPVPSSDCLLQRLSLRRTSAYLRALIKHICALRVRYSTPHVYMRTVRITIQPVKSKFRVKGDAAKR